MRNKKEASVCMGKKQISEVLTALSNIINAIRAGATAEERGTYSAAESRTNVNPKRIDNLRSNPQDQ